MNRPFTEADNGKRISHMGHYGTLEFPLEDPGSATPDEGIIWYDTPVIIYPPRVFHWHYVKPIDVDDISHLSTPDGSAVILSLPWRPE